MPETASIEIYRELLDANAAVTSTLDLEEVLNIIMTKAQTLLDSEAASIFLVEEETEELVLAGSTNLPADLVGKIRFPRKLGVSGWVSRYGEPVVTEDITKDARFYSGVQEEVNFSTTSYLCVPLKIQNRIIGTAQVINRRSRGKYSAEDLYIMEVFARQAAIALENARLHRGELEKKRLEEELKVARAIQQRMLPKADPVIEGYDISGRSYPCRWVGGDYFDFIPLAENRLGIVIADVCGKGIPAAVIMSSIQAAWHTLGDQGLDLQTIVSSLNRYLCRHTDPDKFATGFCGLLELAAGEFHYINCGHNPPYLFRANGEVEALIEGGLVLGAFEDSDYPLEKTELKVGDIILIYTDGLVEAENGEGEMFGDKRLVELIRGLLNVGAKKIIEQIKEVVEKFTQGGQLEDDLTVVCMKRIL